MEDGNGNTIFNVTCACKKVNGSFKIPTVDLPLNWELCHCTSCRHQTGLLAASLVEVPARYPTKFEGPSLACYQSSEKLGRYFCNTCGTHLYLAVKEVGTEICRGLLPQDPKITKLVAHIFVANTKDGGMSSWLPQAPTWSGWAGDSKTFESPIQQDCLLTDTDPEMNPGLLNGHCLCKGVTFSIRRPDSADSVGFTTRLTSEYISNGMQPSTDDFSLTKTKMTNRHKNQTIAKYQASNCNIESRGSMFGYEYQQWARVPIANLVFVNEDQICPELFEDRITTLKKHRSSGNIHQYFCKRCGATCFRRDCNSPDLIDVSVGLFDAQEGSRAERWLDWSSLHVSE